VSRVLEITHGRVKEVEVDIFLTHFAPDCMTHECRCRLADDKVRLDACCQYGADVDPLEKQAILRRADQVAAVLSPAHRDPARWFDDSVVEEDSDMPSGICLRIATSAPPKEDSGCVFLQHDGRGCALHRTALQHGFAPEEIKPAVCRLYPLSFGDGILGFSDDFNDYSCAGDTSGPTVYRLMRGVVDDVFGRDLVRLLDAAEQRVLGRRLPLAAGAL
jgi:hypothetical protein